MAESDEEPAGVAETRPGSTRTFLLAGALVVGVIVLALVLFRPSDASSKFCTADGRLGGNGEVYGRDANQNCQFVDDDGNVIGE